MKKTAWAVSLLTGLLFSASALGGDADELKRFDALCKTDADVIVNGYQFKKSGLSFASIIDTLKHAFSGSSQAAKSGGDDALYLIKMAYQLHPDLNENLIREAAYRLCMKEKLSTDRI